MIDKDGGVKICDFGISYITRRECDHSDVEATTLQARGMKGTPAFLSPEVCSGQPFTAQSDVWALGVTIYVMIFGVLPFNGQSIAEIMSSIITRQLEFPTDGSCTLHPSWQKALRRLLDKDPKERMTLEQFLLCDAMTESSLSPSPPTATNTNRRPRTVEQRNMPRITELVTATSGIDDEEDIAAFALLHDTLRNSQGPQSAHSPLDLPLHRFASFHPLVSMGSSDPSRRHSSTNNESSTSTASDSKSSVIQRRSSIRSGTCSRRHSKIINDLRKASGLKQVAEPSSGRRDEGFTEPQSLCLPTSTTEHETLEGK